MTTNKRFSLSLAPLMTLALSLGQGSVSFGEKMSLEAHDLIIQKLEGSLNQIDDANNVLDSVGLHIQLANLYSDKARLLFLEEEKKDCNNCLKSDSFRAKSLAQYKIVRPQLKGEEFEKISFQMGHLYELNQNKKDALKIYNELIQNKRTSNTGLAKAYSKRASFYFSEGEFSKALSDFNVVLAKSKPEEKGPILHRIAWAQLNKGQIQTATQQLWTVIENEDYLMMPTGKGFNYSPSFHAEVARDLAVFLAKSPITPQMIQRLSDACPEGENVNTLLLLGDEAERTGQSKGAILAWNQALQDKDFPADKKPQTFLKIAQLYRGDLQFKEANTFFLKALSIEEEVFGKDSSSRKCDEECANLTKDFKSYLSTWDRETRKWTSGPMSHESKIGLIEAYNIYHRYHNRDYQTYLGLAQLSYQLKQKTMALQAFARAADLIADRGNANDKKLLEPTLLSEVSLAEESGSNEVRLKSYEHYLKLNYYGAKQNVVRYQRAKVIYELKRWKEAFNYFDECVTDNQFKDADLKYKAAHLSLDALALAHDLETLEAKGLSYAKILPQQKTEFLKIARKAGIEIVKTLALKKVSVDSARNALAKMKTIELDPNDKEEYQTLLKMKIDLSLKAEDWSLARRTLEEFYRIKSLKMNDKIWALKQNLRLAELFLDFTTALSIMKNLGYFNSENPTDLLKGALLTELSGENPTPWLERILHNRKATPSDIFTAQAQIVRVSSNSWSTLKKYLPSLSRKPELVADLALEAFMKEPKLSEAKDILSVRKVAGTWGGQFLARLITLERIKSLLQTIQSQHLNPRSNALLSSTLQTRIRSLNQLQGELKAYQKSKDWTLQVVAAQGLRLEYNRLADEIENLPFPRNLSAKDKPAYSEELIRQASPFRKTGHELEQFVALSWKNIAYLNDLFARAELGVKIHPLFKKELSVLASIAPEAIADDINNVMGKMNKKSATQSKIPGLFKDLREEPLNNEIQSELIQAHKMVGQEAMATFLVARQNSFKGGF